MEKDVVTNYHVSQILTLRRELLEIEPYPLHGLRNLQCLRKRTDMLIGIAAHRQSLKFGQLRKTGLPDREINAIRTLQVRIVLGYDNTVLGLMQVELHVIKTMFDR